MPSHVKGIIFGLIAAVCYGLIPLFTVPMKEGAPADHLSDASILFYRFILHVFGRGHDAPLHVSRDDHAHHDCLLS